MASRNINNSHKNHQISKLVLYNTVECHALGTRPLRQLA